ncbi:hypothetical protein Vadar_033609 [Vaccinium darrowii]|uniref:Uncharacterized protein n=1 Tax=Vaccinium darrowii TaxID=229202 RepID=A0ACB7YJW9_9ERIC|nr:hypothetical protein Vadar_033609 [Vaccinium darrowii]
MVCKRPFLDEEPYDVGSKHPRQHGETAQQSPVWGITHCNDGPQKQFSDEGENSAWKSQHDGNLIRGSADEGENSAWKSQHDGKITRGTVLEDVNGTKKEQELELNASSSISSDLWVNGNVGESFESDAVLHLSFFPHYFELDHRVNRLVLPHDSYSVRLDHDPRIAVSVGPDHQADVPEWAPQCFSQSFGSCMSQADCGNTDKVEGTCIISMPCTESPEYDSSVDGGTRNYFDCDCLDKGSINCVKQHVGEAREKLRENLGQKIFEELGFSSMGEEVAKKWTDGEEQTFREVVFSNPASQGKKFWDHLSATFPYKTKGDLVSYYFNVFMLQKRAEQNWFDPSNIDSDNDEWQISELGINEEDDDSAVESLLDGVEEAGTDTWKDDAADSGNHLYGVGEEDEGDVDDVLVANGGEFVGGCGLGLDPAFQLPSKVSSNHRERQDIEDDSCTSYEYQSGKFDSCSQID